jgi:DNA-binding CsgD family transcriptional regulator
MIEMVEKLTGKEVEVCLLLAQGKTAGEIAKALDVQKNTIKNHLLKIKSKFGISKREKLISFLLDNPAVIGDPKDLVPRSPFPGKGEELTLDEEDVLDLILEGNSMEEIVQKLGISMGSAKNYTGSLLRKRNCINRYILAAKIEKPVRVSA